ncbi:MAG: hypothetical protein WCJ64_14165 [Rhodospirillaceae bacterium]
MSGSNVAELGIAFDTTGLDDAVMRLDLLGQQSQKAGGHLLVVGNNFRQFASDMSAADIGSQKFADLTSQFDRANDSLVKISGSTVQTTDAMNSGFSDSLDKVKDFASALEVIPDTFTAIGHSVDSTFVGIAKGVDLVARGISDLRVIKSVFERDIDEPAKTSGQQLAEMGRHMLELKVVTTGFSAAGADGAASMVGLAARANLVLGAVATLGAGLYEASKASKEFEEQAKSLEAALQFTNSASGISGATATSLIDTASRTTGFDQAQLASTMEELIKARTLGPTDVAATFSAGTAFADASGQDPVAVVKALIGAYNDLGGAAKGLESIGINLDAAERKQLDTFAEAGEKAKGFGVILAEVATRNAEYSDKIDESTASSRRFSAESGELLRNIGDGWRALLSVFEIDISKYLVDPIRDALSQIINMINSTVHATTANLTTRLDLAKKGLSAAEGLASGADTVQEGVDYNADVTARRKEVEALTAALKAAKEAEQTLAAQQGRERQDGVQKYEDTKAKNTGGGAETEDAINAILRQTEALKHQTEAWKQGDEAVRVSMAVDEAHDKFVSGATANEEKYAAAILDRNAAQAEAAGAKDLSSMQHANSDYLELLGQVQRAELSLGDFEDELDNRRYERTLKAQGLSETTIANLMDEYEATKDLTDQYDKMAKAQDDQQKLWESIGKTVGDAFTRPIESAVKSIAEGKSQTIEWGNVFKSIFASLELDLIKMATINPVMNALGLGGSHSPSLFDLNSSSLGGEFANVSEF